MPENYKFYIDGEWREGEERERFPAVNPCDRSTWATIPQASKSDAEEAIDAARRAFNSGWRKTSGLERSRYMNRLADIVDRNADRLALLESTDNGKVIRETRSQMTFAARQYRFYAGYADKLWGKLLPLDQPDILDYASREPLGVALLVISWNSPIHTLANKLAPALAAGNCVVIKPSEHASATTLEFCRFIDEAGHREGGRRRGRP